MSPKKANIPQQKPADPTPDPVPVDVEVLQKQRERRRQRIRQAGRAGTIITEGGLGGTQAPVKKATLLGGEL